MTAKIHRAFWESLCDGSFTLSPQCKCFHTLLCKRNYYQKDEACEASSWFGRGAAYFKLKGPVDSERFKNLMEGKDPKGLVYLGGVKPRDRKDPKTGQIQQHRSGIDVTLAPPKSLSLAAFLDARKDVEQCHRWAVDKALAEIESKFSVCRVGSRGQQKNVVCGNLIVAKFEHDTSRSLDPQMHTHCVIISATRRPDGEWRRINNDVFWKNSKYINDTYLNALKTELEKSNIPIEKHGNSFEISGYEDHLIKNFSKQSEKIHTLVSQNAFKRKVKIQSDHGRDIHKSEKYVERKLKMALRSKKEDHIDRYTLVQKWSEERSILNSAKKEICDDISISGLGYFTQKYFSQFGKMIGTISGLFSEVSIGSFLHENSFAEESFAYASSAVGKYAGGLFGELIGGNVGEMIGEYVGSKVFEFAACEVFESLSHDEGDIHMRQKTKEKFLEEEKNRDYGEDLDVKLDLKSEKSKDKEDWQKDLKETAQDQNQKKEREVQGASKDSGCGEDKEIDFERW